LSYLLISDHQQGGVYEDGFLEEAGATLGW
jgi:hypothetical protein